MLLHVSRNGGKNYMCRKCAEVFAVFSDESLSLQETMPAVVYIAENLDNITDLEVKKIVEDAANTAVRDRPDRP